ncbi:MAG: SLAC1 family transporter [Ferrimicrobium sp.]
MNDAIHLEERKKTGLPSFGFEYFSIVMGSGIVAVLLPDLAPSFLPYARALWVLTALTLVGLSVGSIVLFIRRPRLLQALLDDKARVMFIGCVPMAVSSASNGVVKLYPHLFGPSTDTVMLGVLLGNIAIALVSGIYAPYRLFAHHTSALEEIDATWLLPIVPAEVAAFQAAVLAPHLSQAVGAELVWVGYFLWAMSVPLALTLIGMLLLRLSVHRLYEPHLATSTWLVLGPLGTGAAGIVALGGDAHAIFSPALSQLTGTLVGVGLIGSIALFAYGLWWLILAGAISIRYALRRTYPFGMGWWGFTFPLGVLTSAGWEIAAATKADFVFLLAGSLTVLLVILWAIVAVGTIGKLLGLRVRLVSMVPLLGD